MERGSERPHGSVEGVERSKNKNLKKIMDTVRALAYGVSVFAASEALVKPAEAQEAVKAKPKEQLLHEKYGPYIFSVRTGGIQATIGNPDGTLRIPTPERRERTDDKEPSLTPVKASNGLITEELLQQYLQTYPQNWVNGETESIEQRDDNKFIEKQRFFSRSVAVAVASSLPNGKENITFTKTSRKFDLKDLFFTLSHELAHGNDFERDGDLSTDELMDLALALADRIQTKKKIKITYF